MHPTNVIELPKKDAQRACTGRSFPAQPSDLTSPRPDHNNFAITGLLTVPQDRAHAVRTS